MVEHYGTNVTAATCIETRQLILNNVRLKVQDLLSSIEILTCKGDCCLVVDNVGNNGVGVSKRTWNISTLRMIDLDCDYKFRNINILINLQLNKMLHLQSIVKNLTLHIRLEENDNTGDNTFEWRKMISKILQKDFYYELKNVNTLLDIDIENIEVFFDILKENIQVLKYQFNKLNIGLKILDEEGTPITYYLNETGHTIIHRILNPTEYDDQNSQEMQYSQWMQQIEW